MRAQQGVVDVAGENDAYGGQTRVQRTQVDLCEVTELGAPWAELASVGGEKSGAQRLEHPGAAVGAGTAASRDDHLVAAGVQRGRDELTGPEARGGEGEQAAGR